MLDITRIRAICFDVDGTLSDTDDLMVARLAPWLRPLARWAGRPPERLARRIVMALDAPFNELYALTDHLGIDDELVRLAAWIGRWLPHRPATFRLVPGVRDMLDTLRPYYPLAVISTRPEASTRAFLEHFNLTSYFKVIVTGQTCPRTKPHPDPVLLAAERLGVPPTACLMVGDTPVDIHSGRTAGAQTVGVLCGFGDEAELRRAGADLILPTTADLLDLLGRPPGSAIIKP